MGEVGQMCMARRRIPSPVLWKWYSYFLFPIALKVLEG